MSLSESPTKALPVLKATQVLARAGKVGSHFYPPGSSHSDRSHLADVLKSQPVHLAASSLGVEDGNRQEVWVRGQFLLLDLPSGHISGRDSLSMPSRQLTVTGPLSFSSTTPPTPPVLLHGTSHWASVPASLLDSVCLTAV